MAIERFVIRYEPLFTVRVLHRFFLNFGPTAFDAGAPPAGVQKALAYIRGGYEVSHFWQISPDEATRQVLQNQRMLFKKLPDGFFVGVEVEKKEITTGGAPETIHLPLVDLAEDLTLSFNVFQADPLFLLYTDLQKPVMDALMGSSKAFRLENAVTNADLTANDLNQNETIRNADLQDRPEAKPGDGIRKPPLGLIRIRHRPSDGKSLLAGNGSVQSTLTYTIRLRNRTTHWKHQGTDLGPFALVQYGRIPVMAGSRPLPNPPPAATVYEPADGRFYSVIY